MNPSFERHAFPVELDRPRTVFFDMAATWKLDRMYGPTFISKLYTVAKDEAEVDGKPLKMERLEMVSLDSFANFLAIGLEREARDRGEEPLTAEQVVNYLGPWNYHEIFRRVVYAVIGVTATPELLGKVATDGDAAKPAVAPAAANLGPTKASTMTKRSASRTRSSAGRRKSSGR